MNARWLHNMYKKLQGLAIETNLGPFQTSMIEFSFLQKISERLKAIQTVNCFGIKALPYMIEFNNSPIIAYGTIVHF